MQGNKNDRKQKVTLKMQNQFTLNIQNNSK